jgi:O-antigen/teichoic acid export membrane protein
MILWFGKLFNLLRSREFRRSTFHFNWAIVDQAVVSGANFAISILLARTMGAERFGAFVLAWMAVNLIQAIQHSAINTVVLTIGPKLENAARASHDSFIFLQQVVFGTVTALISWLGVHFLSSLRPDWHLDSLALPLAFAVLFCQTQDFFRRYLFSIQRPNVGFLVDLIRYLSPFGLLLVYIQWGPGTLTAAAVLWIIGLSAALAVASAIYFVPKLTWTGSTLWSAAQSNWRFSKWLVASSILSWGWGNLNYFAAAILIGASATAYLRVAQTLLGFTNILFLGIENVLPIQSSRKFVEGGIPALNRYLIKIALIGLIPTVIVDGFFVLFPLPALSFFFGNAYAPASSIVQLYALADVIFFLTVPAMVWLRTVEQTRRIFHAYLASFVTSIIIVYPAISYLGTTGAAVSILVVTIVNLTALAIGIRWSLHKLVDAGAIERNARPEPTISVSWDNKL